MSLDHAAARTLLDRWDRQQSAYVAHREARFEAMLTVLRLQCGDKPVVLDLACGPGPISDRVLTAFPGATTIAVDYDPVLLEIARGALSAYGDRARVHDADLAADGWESVLGGTRVDAVLSSTALHWLTPGELLGAYTTAGRLLPSGGLLLNADHLRFDEGSALHDLSGRHDAETQRNGFGSGALDYAGWHAEAYAHPELSPLVAERDRRFEDRMSPRPLTPLDFHLAALRTAGFTESGTVWQYLDDYIVYGRR